MQTQVNQAIAERLARPDTKSQIVRTEETGKLEMPSAMTDLFELSTELYDKVKLAKAYSAERRQLIAEYNQVATEINKRCGQKVVTIIW